MSSQIGWRLRDFVLQRLAHTRVGQLFFFVFAHTVHQFEKALEALVFQLWQYNYGQYQKQKGKLPTYLKVLRHLRELAVSMDIADSRSLCKLNL